jgi:hypothetical protein
MAVQVLLRTVRAELEAELIFDVKASPAPNKYRVYLSYLLL